MIAVIGGVLVSVDIRLKPPARDAELQKKQDDEALRLAGIDPESGEEMSAGGQKLEGFSQYYERTMRQQASENYWNEVGIGSGQFGGYAPVVADRDTDIRVATSGCAFNVARHLAADHGADVKFISVVGDDAFGLAAKCELERAGVDVSGVKTLGGATPVSVEMHNIIGELQFQRENSSIMEGLTPEVIDVSADILDAADIIFVDGTVPADTLDHISDKYSGKSRIFFDPGSIAGGARFADSAMKAHCVLPGRMEAEAMSGLQVLGMDQLMAAGQAFEERGVDRVIITLKGGGLYFKEGTESGLIKPERKLTFAETRGAGDVLSAAVVAASLGGEESLEEAAAAGIEAAAEFLRDAIDERPY
ncbi:MAG: carbohydrate kinase family protein [Bacillota bacterium]